MSNLISIGDKLSIPQGILDHASDDLDIMNVRWAKTRSELLHSAVPIFATNDFYKPEAYGTGVLLEFEGRTLLVSAAHTLDIVHKRHIYIPNDTLMGPGKEILGTFYASMKPDEGRKKDSLDFSFVELNDETIKAVKACGYKPIKHDQIDMCYPDSKNSWYSLIGFPGNRSSLNEPDRYIAMEPLMFTTVEYDQPLSKPVRLRFDKDINLALDATKPRSEKSGHIIKNLDLAGCSGGPVWRIQNFSDWLSAPMEPRFSGIFFELVQTSRTLLMCIRSSVLLWHLAAVYGYSSQFQLLRDIPKVLREKLPLGVRLERNMHYDL